MKVATEGGERARGGGDRGPGADDRRTPREDSAPDVERRARDVAEGATRAAARLIARAREELEDIWAEARDRRRKR